MRAVFSAPEFGSFLAGLEGIPEEADLVNELRPVDHDPLAVE